MNDLRILVTGSNGLLGQKLVEILTSTKKDGISFLATSRGKNRNPALADSSYKALDVTDKNALREVLLAFHPDVIIHTAAMTQVDHCEADPELCHALNVDAVKNLAELADKIDSHLIHLSTDFIFDGESGPYVETDSARPLSVYGESKWEAEQIVKQMTSSWTILRTILVYGVVPDASRSNIVLWAKSALERKEKIRVIDDQWRMPTLVDDLALACIAAARGKKVGVYHISGPELLSIYELVLKIADFWGLDTRLIEKIDTKTLNQPAARPPRTGFILEKARRELGFRPRDFVGGLKIVEEQLVRN